MAGLIPFNRRNGGLMNFGFEDFNNMLDDFFSDGWAPSRSLMRDTFKIDVRESDGEYLIDAELPGVNKEEVSLDVENDILRISVKRVEEVNQDSRNYIHRERRASSMARSVRLTDAELDGIKAKLENGVLAITVPKKNKAGSSRKIDIE